MQKIIAFLLLLLLVVLIVQKIQIPNFKIQTNTKFQNIQIDGKSLQVEIAKTPEALTKGLGGRDAIGSDGMLFILPTRQVPHFWMKDMHFDLDFVWIDGGKVVALTPRVSAQRGESDQLLKVYSPGLSATHVLELNSGEIEKLGIKIGLDFIYSPGVH